MPTYEYRCERCGDTVEVVQSFSDGPLTTCEWCGGPLRKVYAPVGIVFKGSGFYKTDSRSSPKSSKTAGTASDAGGSSEKHDQPEKKDTAKKEGAAAASSSSTSDSGSSGSSTPAAATGASAKKD
jgi:putative FmdB family regulatory protein